MVATALGSCMLTIIGIKAEASNIKLGDINVDITKVMSSSPRRIAEIIVEITFSNTNYTDKEKKVIENAARTCPVALSLNPEIKQTLILNF